MSNELTDVRCPCGAEFQADSYDAGFIAGSGMCQNCDAALPPKDICTCPSGNGSLRHPCPAHPASVEQAGGDERAAFELFVRKHCGMPAHIAVNWDAKFTNDAWAGWQARAALAQPSPAQTQPSPAPTLRAAIDVANDRFEVPVAKWGTDLVGEEERPEVAEVAFVLRNIGAMDAEDIDGDNVDLRFEDAEGRDTGCDVSIVEYAEKAADLFEQHDRIVGDLRADRDSWAEQAEQRLADWDEMRKERDAALARVAELEKQEPVATIAKVPGEDWNGLHFYRDLQGMQPGTKLYAAPVAQAQHSVQELLEWAVDRWHAEVSLRPLINVHRRALDDTWRQVIRHLGGDTGLLCGPSHDELLAAAPGKEVGHE
ncbi:hypothetical protein QK428_03640 [Pseudomonas aeruginosa]|nr:hypothetical protein [Pseudomonas aeruginosa]